MLSINIANAQTSAVTDNIFQNAWSVVSQAISSAVSFVVDLFVGDGDDKTMEMCSTGPSNSDWLGQVQKF